MIIFSRFAVGIYKEYFLDVTGRNLPIMYIQLILADLLAFAIFYLIQTLIPPVLRITLVRLACFVGFSLVEAIVCRLGYCSGFTLDENDRRILEAAAKSGKTVDEIVDLLEK